MCGIVGWTDFSGRHENGIEILKNMAEKLVHRGPDASGFWASEHIALGHRRLVVVDPEGGQQPMFAKRGSNSCSCSGSNSSSSHSRGRGGGGSISYPIVNSKEKGCFAMVYNGELYNTEDIRQELTQKGYSFNGWSDTEVLLNAYIEWGEQCVPMLNGIFAFAIWDGEKQELFLARDRIGVKPLFYCQNGSAFLFASELKALLAHPMVSAKVNREGLAEIFALGPARTPGNGIFSGLLELKPGYCMHVSPKGIRLHQYWSLNSHAHEETFENTVNHVRELVYDSIKRQLVSDVPLCVLLSGGLDSSAITAIASEVYQKQGKEKLNTFSIDYKGNDAHFRPSEFQPNADAPWVKKVSEYLGTIHSEYLIDTPELINALFPSVLARDLPGMTDVDSSLLLFSQKIKMHATVGLSGECADEVFGGYPWFYKTIATANTTFPWSQKLDERIKLYSPELINLIKPNEYVAQRYLEAIDEVPRLNGDDPIDDRMREMFYLNLTRWMPTLLDRKDRMSMASGLELRVPFCDHRLVEYLWNVPWKMKNHKNREKGLLRQALTGILPEDVLWRKKSPYPKTHNPAYLEAVRELMLSVLDDSASPLLPFINKKTVKELALSVKRDTNIPWFGQLMNAPQLFAYLIQVDFWLKEYGVVIE